MYITGVDPTVVSTTPEFTPGALGLNADGKMYKYVIYDEGTGLLDLVTGDVVYYVDVTGYLANTVTADVTDSTGAELGAGVVLATVTADASFFWVQIRGAAVLSTTIGGTPADGDPLTAVAAADKALTKAAEADTAATYVSVVAFGVDVSDKEIACAFPM